MLQNIEEYGQDEIDELEDLISTGATTAETVEQLALEVETLQGLERWRSGVLARAWIRNGASSTAFSTTN
jgi:hypothetical protein